jgi:dUTP pyrophosphatase
VDKIAIPFVANAGCLPEYKSRGASGADLKADISSEIRLKPGERRLVPTGFWLQVPSGYEAQIRPRSGLAMQHGVTLLNSPGTVDSDYRGEVKVILVNLSQQEVVLRKGDRIAQIVICPVAKAEFVQQENLEITDRGEGGFGSTGI